MKKHFIGTFTELQKKLDYMIGKQIDIVDIKYIQELCAVDSFDQDNVIRIFLIETKEKGMK